MLEIFKVWSGNWSPFYFALIKLIINLLDFITLPIYYVIQKPYKRLEESQRIRAKKDSNGDWVRVGKVVPHELFFLKDQTLVTLWNKVCKQNKDKSCLGTRKILSIENEIQKNGKTFTKYVLDDHYSYLTYQELDEKVNHLMAGFLKIGIKSQDKIGIFAETRAEWLLSALSLFKIGAILVTLYPNLGDDGVVDVLNQTKVNFLITTFELAPKLKAFNSSLNFLKVIIYFSPKSTIKFDPSSDHFKFIPFSSIEHEPINNNIDSLINEPKLDMTALIMFTSGSTGVPKGVIITHRAFNACIKSFYISFFSTLNYSNEDTMLAYLPLAHILEFGNEFVMLFLGIKIAYSSVTTLMNTSSAIKSGDKGDILIAKPTFIPGVPLVIDRIKKSIEKKIESQSCFKKSLFKFAFLRKKSWTKYGFTTPLMDKFVFRPVCQSLGGNCKIIFVGGAPLSLETHQFIENVLCLKIIQGYAATEVTATATLVDLDDMSYNHVGSPLFGVKIRLQDWEEGGYKTTDKPNPRGEVLISSEGVSEGYFENDKETSEAFVTINSYRYWKSGDIGEFHPNGTLTIIDRKKDLVKLSHGEYISLNKIESVLKSSIYVEMVWVFGSSLHQFLIAFIIPNKNNLESLATELYEENLSWAQICSDLKVNQKLLEILMDFCKKAELLKYEIPQKIKICNEEWTQEKGLVTAVQKLRRIHLAEYYEKDIKQMYS